MASTQGHAQAHETVGLERKYVAGLKKEINRRLVKTGRAHDALRTPCCFLFSFCLRPHTRRMPPKFDPSEKVEGMHLPFVVVLLCVFFCILWWDFLKFLCGNCGGVMFLVFCMIYLMCSVHQGRWWRVRCHVIVGPKAGSPWFGKYIHT